MTSHRDRCPIADYVGPCPRCWVARDAGFCPISAGLKLSPKLVADIRTRGILGAYAELKRRGGA